jgi:hypothetical protein
MHQGASTVEISIAELRALVNCSKPFYNVALQEEEDDHQRQDADLTEQLTLVTATRNRSVTQSSMQQMRASLTGSTAMMWSKQSTRMKDSLLVKKQSNSNEHSSQRAR